MENTSALYFPPNYTHLKKSSYIYLHTYMMIYYTTRIILQGVLQQSVCPMMFFYPLCYYWYLTNNEFIFSD